MINYTYTIYILVSVAKILHFPQPSNERIKKNKNTEKLLTATLFLVSLHNDSACPFRASMKGILTDMFRFRHLKENETQYNQSIKED